MKEEKVIIHFEDETTKIKTNKLLMILNKR